MESLQSRVRELCDRFGIIPSKLRGQNYCVDSRVLDGVVAAAQLTQGEQVIEIGPGFGFLTERLIATGAQMKVVEIEEAAAAYVRDTFGKQIEVVQDDAIGYAKRTNFPKEYSVVGMVPYSITSLLFRTFLERPDQPRQVVFVIQKEVAERICAKDGEKSLLSVAVQYYGAPKIISKVSHASFWPRPKVDSALIRVEITREFADSDAFFFRVVKAAFASKRKKMIRNIQAELGGELETLISVFSSSGISENARAQELSIEQWILLTKELSNQYKK